MSAMSSAASFSPATGSVSYRASTEPIGTAGGLGNGMRGGLVLPGLVGLGPGVYPPPAACAAAGAPTTSTTAHTSATAPRPQDEPGNLGSWDELREEDIKEGFARTPRTSP